MLTITPKITMSMDDDHCGMCGKKRKLVKSETEESCCRDCANWMDYKGQYINKRS